jgi:hypothetical protein
MTMSTLVRQAIAERLGNPAGRGLIAVIDDYMPGVTLVHVNSGGNAFAVESALRADGYLVGGAPHPDYGACVFVVPPVGPNGPLPAHGFNPVTFTTSEGPSETDWCGFGAAVAEVAQDDSRFCGRLCDDPVHI